MRKKIIAGNWKMNLDKKSVDSLVDGILKGLPNITSSYTILVYPSTVHLNYVTEAFKGTNVLVGCQNIYPSKLAAFTGETSCDQLKDLGIEYVLIGHSERRQFLGETDSFLNQKVHHAISEKMLPMLCVGETLQEREANQTFTVVKRQIIEGLKNISKEDILKVSIAYEPVWAIGTGKVATPEQAEEVHAFLRKELSELYSETISSQISVLYGGSVKPDNIKSLMDKPNIDGGLVGGASQKSDSFLGLMI
jgi:triosephosphate isomerase (TIM)